MSGGDHLSAAAGVGEEAVGWRRRIGPAGPCYGAGLRRRKRAKATIEGAPADFRLLGRKQKWARNGGG
jgi:hypothetical protein